MKVEYIIISIILINLSLGNFVIKSPSPLVDQLTKINQITKGEVHYRLGNFGEIPFGKTLNGFIYLFDIIDTDNNDWCDDLKFNHVDEAFEGLVPIVIANDKNCPFTQKAKNVQNAKGAALIIYTEGERYDFKQNIDDLEYGSNLSIPTLIIKNSSGTAIIDYASQLESNKNTESTRVLASVSFKSLLSSFSDKINMTFFFRSDKINALHFFKEFKFYKDKLGDKLNFKPYYKYYSCINCQSSLDMDDNDSTGEGCIGNFCGGFNPELNIVNPKLVALENLRQKCIYENTLLDTYWNYMIAFSDTCAEVSNPNFTKDCSLGVMSKVEPKIDSTVIDKCMNETKESLKKSDGYNKIEDDINAFSLYKVYRYPQIEVNGKKYKGSWYGKHVFHSLCMNLSDNTICEDIKTEETKNTYRDITVPMIVLLVFIVVSIILVIACCYRRYVNKLLENSIEERIFKQTEHSIGNYTRMDKDTVVV